MFPLPRMLVYDNKKGPPWWQGTDLLAYDSSLFQSTSFVDYLNNTVLVESNPLGVSGNAPELSNQNHAYGKFIQMNSGAIGCATLGYQWMQTEFSLDYWVKYTKIGSDNRLPLFPFSTNNNTGGAAWYLQPRDGSATALDVNNGSIWVTSSNNSFTYMKDNNFHHLAIQYRITPSKVMDLYVDGFLKLTLNLSSFTPPGSSSIKNGYILGNYRTRSESYAAIERVRLRTGENFIGSSFDMNTLYPK